MGTFILTLPMDTTTRDRNILNKRFEISRQIYNSLLGMALKRYKELIKTKAYRECVEQIKMVNNSSMAAGDKAKAKKAYNDKLLSMNKEYKLTKSALEKDVKPMQNHFKMHIDSASAQKLAFRVLTAVNKMLYSSGRKLHFKKYGQLNSVEGKQNVCIYYSGGCIQWKGLKIPVKINNNNVYEQMCLSNRVKYVRIVRKTIKNKTKFYAQLVLEGVPPAKYNPDGTFRHKLGIGRVGIDPGTSTMAVASPNQVRIFELAKNVQSIDHKLKLYQRKLARSRRYTNPDNYNSDGTIKKGIKLTWNRSNNYLRTLAKIQDLHRRSSDERKQQHEILANEIISYGNEFYIEKMNYKALQKRSKETKTNAKGKYISKKRFGKSLANRAPAMFVSILKQKLSNHGIVLNYINTVKARASQYNHVSESYIKKELSDRWVYIGEDLLQRDLYSAFLIQNINSDLCSFNKELLETQYSEFKNNHDQEIQKLITDNNTLSSVGIKIYKKLTA
ncbi:hypothetical protein [Ruminococcus albus]|uniref:hypothetical protein n=1 Tax=Ruminococcus albus TaxID=1264 RepID=UPI0004AFC47C|nr:hypothetical protein [Ruminococcus albus]